MLESIDFFDDIEDVYFESSKMPELPSNTVLYGLEPIGVGAGACESIRSYINRLADAHRVSPMILMQELIANHAKELTGHSLLMGSSWALKTSRKNFHIGKTAASLSGIISMLTGIQSLEFCTMFPIAEVIGAMGLTQKRQQYHCPLCIQVKKSVPIYGQLIWEFGCISACPIHKIRLVETSCGSKKHLHITNTNRKNLSGVCSFCGKIGYRCRGLEVRVASETDVWRAHQIAELISYFPDATRLFSKENLVSGLHTLIVQSFDGVSAAAAKKAGIHKSVLWGWVNGRFSPSMPQLLDLCMVSGVSLVSVLTGEPKDCKSPVQSSIIKPAIKKIKATNIERETALRLALLLSPPISLSVVARGLMLDTTTLSKQFPVLSADVIKRFKQFQNETIANRHQDELNIALDVINRLQTAGIPCTRRNLSKLTNTPLMPKERLAIAIKKILDGEYS